MTSATIVFLVLWFEGIAYIIYATIRNEWVFDVRVEALKNSEFIGGKFVPYDYLPSYDEMLEGHGFWRWDIEYYIKYDGNKTKDAK